MTHFREAARIFALSITITRTVLIYHILNKPTAAEEQPTASVGSYRVSSQLQAEPHHGALSLFLSIDVSGCIDYASTIM